MPFHENNVGGLVYMTAPNISAVHAFTTRSGGVSSGCFSSLNLGENRGDRPEDVMENYNRLCRALGAELSRIVVSRQVHETVIRTVTEADIHTLGRAVPYEADGLITEIPELPVFIYTADCIPILMEDTARRAVGAVHAGWRGTVKNIAGKAVEEMARSFGSKPEDIRCAIGPGIGKCCFETDAEVPAAINAVLGSRGDSFFDSKPNGKFTVDLKGVNRELLIRAGIPAGNIEVSDECTMCSHEKYWSHRHTGGKRGSQASVIMLKGKA